MSDVGALLFVIGVVNVLGGLGLAALIIDAMGLPRCVSCNGAGGELP
jgi:hypothetical protein